MVLRVGLLSTDDGHDRLGPGLARDNQVGFLEPPDSFVSQGMEGPFPLLGRGWPSIRLHAAGGCRGLEHPQDIGPVAISDHKGDMDIFRALSEDREGQSVTSGVLEDGQVIGGRNPLVGRGGLLSHLDHLTADVLEQGTQLGVVEQFPRRGLAPGRGMGSSARRIRSSQSGLAQEDNAPAEAQERRQAIVRGSIDHRRRTTIATNSSRTRLHRDPSGR